MTGCTSGIGLEIARALVLAGSAKRLVLAVRNVELADKLARQWKEEATQRRKAGADADADADAAAEEETGMDIEARRLDLASISSVRREMEERAGVGRQVSQSVSQSFHRSISGSIAGRMG